LLLRRALLLLVLLLRRALLRLELERLGLQLCLALLLFVVLFHGFVSRAARPAHGRVWFHRRDCVVCTRRLLHC